MPASTSSKTSPGADPLGGRSAASLKPKRAVAVSVLIASMIRDSSPPDTIRASGRRSSPGFGETKNSAASMPRALHSDSGSAPSAKRTSNRVRSIASRESIATSRRANAAAARRRAFASVSAADKYAARARRRWRSSSSMRSSPP